MLWCPDQKELNSNHNCHSLIGDFGLNKKWLEQLETRKSSTKSSLVLLWWFLFHSFIQSAILRLCRARASPLCWPRRVTNMPKSMFVPPCGELHRGVPAFVDCIQPHKEGPQQHRELPSCQPSSWGKFLGMSEWRAGGGTGTWQLCQIPNHGHMEQHLATHVWLALHNLQRQHKTE